MYHLFVKNIYIYLQLSFVVSDVQDGQLSKMSVWIMTLFGLK